MNDEEIEIIMSPLCQSIERDGKSVRVDIYDDGDGKWILEVVDEFGNSVVWDDHFSTDQKAIYFIQTNFINLTDHSIFC